MEDKFKHIFIGAFIAFVVGILVYEFNIDDAGNVDNKALWCGVFAGFICSVIGGCIKEWCDMHTDGNKWDWWDLTSTLIGGVIASLFICGIHFCNG